MQGKNKDVLLLLGTNQGDRVRNLAAAREGLATLGTMVATSHIYRTAAWGKTDQPDFYNQAVNIATGLSPTVLLEKMLALEKSLGRERLERWGQRIIDIDLLFYGQQVIDTATLTVPHPQIAVRRFALVPLDEIAPSFHHPLLNKNIRTLLRECPDTLAVEKLA